VPGIARRATTADATVCGYAWRSRATGATADLKQRIADHNAGKSTHTAKFKPWKLIWYCAFPDKYKALAFEKYLKSHSGRAFAKKRL
jgi:predicted GIY-YIG superfamily endonuclease